ncbi:MAG TPA: UDP-N-acetylmuramoyl-L-alanyl-D-glutamate--2,6-diaminopimelate ligase, partial [Clostridiales bacterium]|nr:UDP-N-acetylmuramoyl-L-alanyl-D-glutamate--2,6-diaminopimelate ligase [Clostridiales bacterium]
KSVRVEVDRKKAIGLALSLAKEGDIVLLAGKGHETTQTLADKTIEFDERKIVKEILANK